MKVALAYICVLLIWSTTPLAIKWSNGSLDFMLAVSVRMFIAALLCSAILAVLRKPLVQNRREVKAMLAGALGLFPNMLLVYWSAQYIPSGLMSILLGFYPFFVGAFSILLMRENPFNYARVMALLIALAGLVIINVAQIKLGSQAVLGVAGILLSSVNFSLSTVALKKLGGGTEPLRQLSGSLIFATPMFVLCWWFLGGDIPHHIDNKSLFAIIYLVIAGSMVGGLAFYFVLHHCSVSTVSLIPLFTPVLALVIGYLFAGERLTLSSLIGSALILLSVAVYQGVFNRMMRRLSQFWGSIVFRAAKALS